MAKANLSVMSLPEQASFSIIAPDTIDKNIVILVTGANR
jgi:hypothetical protein